MENGKKDLIVRLFCKLEEESIRYCILRNYETLPDEVGHDIDVLLDGKDNSTEIKEKITSLIESLEWKQKCIYDKDSFFTIICYRIVKDKVETLKLDLWTNLCWRGIPWIDVEKVLETRRKSGLFFVPDKSCEAAITSVKELIGGGNIPSKYYTKIGQYAAMNPDLIDQVFKKSFRKKNIMIRQKLISKEFYVLDNMKKKLRRNLLLNNPKMYLKNSLHRIFMKLYSFFAPKGKLIAFIGPDGSGKTSIINMEEDYLEVFFSKIIKYHIRFNLFPELKTGFGFSSMKGKLIEGSTHDEKEEITNTKNQNEPIKRSFISKLASWFVVIYYSVEFLVGRVLIKKHRIKRRLVLFDRYYYDFFAQPTSRELIKKYKGILLLFAKKPDIVIHLNANPEVVFARKQELSIKEIKMQNIYLKESIQTHKNAYSIDTNIKTEQEIASEVFEIIISNL